MAAKYIKWCPECRKQTEVGTRFCAACGHQFRSFFAPEDAPAGPGHAEAGGTPPRRRLPQAVILALAAVTAALRRARKSPTHRDGP